MYAPEPPQLVKVREHIADTWPEIQKLTRAKAFETLIGELGGERLTRVPRGYPADHPAADILRHKQFLAGRELPRRDSPPREDFYPSSWPRSRPSCRWSGFFNEPLGDEGWAAGSALRASSRARMRRQSVRRNRTAGGSRMRAIRQRHQRAPSAQRREKNRRSPKAPPATNHPRIAPSRRCPEPPSQASVPIVLRLVRPLDLARRGTPPAPSAASSACTPR